MTNNVVLERYLKHGDDSWCLDSLAGDHSLSSSGAEATTLTAGMLFEASSGLST